MLTFQFVDKVSCQNQICTRFHFEMYHIHYFESITSKIAFYIFIFIIELFVRKVCFYYCESNPTTKLLFKFNKFLFGSESESEFESEIVK